MATRKKKEPKVTIDNNTNMSSGGWPRITQGSHLTVIEHENGHRELRWDDDALMRDVKAAIDSVSSKKLK